MHLRLDAAPAVVAAPSEPERTAKVFRGAQGFVSGHGDSGDGLSRLRVLAGRDNSMGAAVGNGVVAFACVVGKASGCADRPQLRRRIRSAARARSGQWSEEGKALHGSQPSDDQA